MYEGEDTVYVEREEVLKLLEQQTCEDAISREEAEAIFKNARKSLYELSRKEQVKDFQTREMMLLNAEQFIHLLPAVTPKFTDAEIQTMQELEQAQLEKAYELGKAEMQPCDDCISRTALLAKIDEERKHLLDLKMDGAEHILVHHARRIVEDMPTVTPKERWIPVSERLPKEEGWYLVSLGNAWDKNNLGKVIQGKKIYNSNVRLSQYKDGKFYHGMVAAWMDEPEPYREIAKEEES
jgi:hypothetical protein